MSELDPILAELDLDFERIEAEFRVCEERKAIAERLRTFGVRDRAYARAEKYAGRLGLTMPPSDMCTVEVYRDTGPQGRETGGGVQIIGQRLSDLGVTRYALRVPVYYINETGGVRPIGGAFDDFEQAEMVAAQCDGLIDLATSNGMELTPDLSTVASQAEDQRDMVIFTCPVFDTD